MDAAAAQHAQRTYHDLRQIDGLLTCECKQLVQLSKHRHELSADIGLRTTSDMSLITDHHSSD